MKCPDCDEEMKGISYHTYRCEVDKVTATLEYDGDYE